MSVWIRDRNDRKRIPASKRIVKVRLFVETAIGKLRRRCACAVGLIPDGKNPALAVAAQKGGVAVIDAGVQKTQDYIFAGIPAAVEILRLYNAGDF